MARATEVRYVVSKDEPDFLTGLARYPHVLGWSLVNFFINAAGFMVGVLTRRSPQ